jgi:hypothetical protein
MLLQFCHAQFCLKVQKWESCITTPCLRWILQHYRTLRTLYPWHIPRNASLRVWNNAHGFAWNMFTIQTHFQNSFFELLVFDSNTLYIVKGTKWGWNTSRKPRKFTIAVNRVNGAALKKQSGNNITPFQNPCASQLLKSCLICMAAQFRIAFRHPFQLTVVERSNLLVTCSFRTGRPLIW